MSDREIRWRRSVECIVTCFFHGGIVFFLVHAKPAYRPEKMADQSLTIFLVKSQPAIALALPKQSLIERRSLERQDHLLESEPPVPDVPVSPAETQLSGDAANIDWTAEAQRAADAISSRIAPGKSDLSVGTAGRGPWDPHAGRLESTPDGVKLRLSDRCSALLHNWTHDPLLGTKGELQLNCNWSKPPLRGDLFDSIRQAPSNE